MRVPTLLIILSAKVVEESHYANSVKNTFSFLYQCVEKTQVIKSSEDFWTNSIKNII